MTRSIFGPLALALALSALLAGCAGTIQRESQAGVRRLEGATFKSVTVVLTDAAKKLQAGSPQFSSRELGEYVQRQLDAGSLLRPDGRHRIEITVENFRVRHVLAAVMFGIMAGTDSIDGDVRVFDEVGRQLHAFKVNASYGLGGVAGGQDSMRMNWMYQKFSELTVAELTGKTAEASIKPRGASSSMAPPRASPALPPVVKPLAAVSPILISTAAPQPAPIATGYARIDDVDAVPYISDKARNSYREWIGRATPKAFAVSADGHWAASWGLKPADPNAPHDPSDRALYTCQQSSKAVPCRLYAVNGSVVWTKEVEPKDQLKSSP